MRHFLMAVSLFFFTLAHGRAEVTTFTVNPETLRARMLTHHMGLSQALLQVQEAKLNVGMARAKLLPTINLVALLPALANPTFLLASIAFMFPFLIPSNWAVLKQQKELFEADKEAFHALQLNVYASALSLYHTYLLDAAVRNVILQESQLLEQIYWQLKKQSDVLGNVAADELLMARAAWQDSLAKISRLDELLLQERSHLRKMLDLPLGSELVVESSVVSASAFETSTPADVSVHSLNVAPETRQLQHLLKAAKAGRFAKAMGFLDSASISGNSFNGEGSAFGQLRIGGGFVFGVDQVMNVKLAHHQLKVIELRKAEQRLEHETGAEIALGRMQELYIQMDLAQRTHADRLDVLRSQRRQFGLGLLPLQQLLLTQSQLSQTQIEELKANWQLTLQRLALRRQTLESPFDQLKGCRSNKLPKPERGWLGIRWRRAQSLDVVCRAP